MTLYRRPVGTVLVGLAMISSGLATVPASATHQRVDGTVLLYGGTHSICETNLGCVPFLASTCQPNELIENNPFGNVRRVSAYTSQDRRADFRIEDATPDAYTSYVMIVHLRNAACGRSASNDEVIIAPLGRAKEISIPRGTVWAVVYTCCATAPPASSLRWSITFRH